MLKLRLTNPLRALTATPDREPVAPADHPDGPRTRSALAAVGLWPPPGERGGR